MRGTARRVVHMLLELGRAPRCGNEGKLDGLLLAVSSRPPGD